MSHLITPGLILHTSVKDGTYGDWKLQLLFQGTVASVLRHLDGAPFVDQRTELLTVNGWRPVTTTQYLPLLVTEERLKDILDIEFRNGGSNPASRFVLHTLPTDVEGQAD